MVRATGFVLLVATVLAACGTSWVDTASEPPVVPATQPGTTPVTTPGPVLRYVALGDSYTIGTSVAQDARWPNQLLVALGASEAPLDLVANLGVNGYTSRDVIDVELPQLGPLRPDFLTLLIGVNDVVQGVPADAYRANAAEILDDLVVRVGARRVLVVTTPDYTVTPAGADFGDPARQAAGIRANNEIISALSAARGITVVDIYDLSLRAATDRSLVASDGLHPSGAQYALWVERIAPTVDALVRP
ncbi:MAG: SGNH/GDSL hydrolase family protein [Chloroflexota bacterium]